MESIRIDRATDLDRRTIYGLRHRVYALELGQHAARPEAELTDALDVHNEYLTASVNAQLAGFVSLTPPGGRYSIDKYIARGDLAFPVDDGLWEVRLLTVLDPWRGGPVAALLMYAALRQVEAAGGTRIVAIGRREIRDFYIKAGLKPLGRQFHAGAVTYELMSARVTELRRHVDQQALLLRRLGGRVDWRLSVPFTAAPICYHGGAFFEAIGEQFDDLSRRHRVINADVLDAWFPPAPGVLDALHEHLPWLLRTSPPTQCAGMLQTIGSSRGLDVDGLVPAAGSSALIFLALPLWLSPSSRALILDPSYGEYAHVLEHVVGCRVTRVPLARRDNYRVDLDRLAALLRETFDLVVLVNPNNPTGQHISADALQQVLTEVPPETVVWIDEAYVDYVDPNASLERWAQTTSNVVVCKSLSKGLALSGVRAAYLCGARRLVDSLRRLTPPWAVALPAQLAVVTALRDSTYYVRRYHETHALREELAAGLRTCGGLDVLAGTTNSVLCHLPDGGPTAAEVAALCRQRDLFIRDAGATSRALGDRVLRVAVKDGHINRRIVELMGASLVQLADTPGVGR
jgi:histidinol-phosphate/aromatic aminotransferase/cobyric acid decarboxylase-like protein/GNAT superfamily N-acetyltransferase